MRYFFVLIFIFFFVTNKAYSDVIKPIIINLEKADNYNFKFKQQINKKIETGTCILVFNRKINCIYDKSDKILVSDGKNLIIKSGDSNIPNFYKLKNTSFYKLLDKNFLIDELAANNIKNENDKLFITLNYQNVDIKIFFDTAGLYLSGWETTDIYNNYVFTEIEIKEVNDIVDENIFDLKKYN
tara:strand:- start:579 stop:1130 length:552 start_codon:yes stop_codon:yes gene_type:complete